ncbi:MAG: DUF309 domain-containing protein [Desulfobulbaceae bacterium]|nr:DUF309 domain-containing protein [Desulfobulbaceae bacterium]
MINQGFDPFRDRLSRDIRNNLSVSLLTCLQQHQLTAAQTVADRFLAGNIAPCHAAYIHDRLNRYAKFLDLVAGGPAEVVWQGLVLWDLGLFFEVHEILEQAWLRSAGAEKSFLQALIRAAGVYIKREYGFDYAAAKMAAKAVPVLATNRHRLAVYTDPERLLAALASATEKPPLLLK